MLWLCGKKILFHRLKSLKENVRITWEIIKKSLRKMAKTSVFYFYACTAHTNRNFVLLSNV